MDHRDTLTVFAEVSVAFAGFAGLVGVLARRLSGEAATLATLRFRGAIEWALLVLAFSLAPLVLVGFAPRSPWVWRVLSVALAASAFSYSLTAYRLLRSLRYGGHLYRAAISSWVYGFAVLLFVNGLGLLGREPLFYLGGLLAYLLVAMLLFVRLLRSLLSQGDVEPAP